MFKTDAELLLKYEKYPYMDRLTLLMANQSKLLKWHSENALRMQGTTQSYHIHDSQ